MDVQIDFVPTKASQIRNLKPTEVEVVSFNSYKPKGKKKKPVESDFSISASTTKDFNMKRSKYEVMKFGMSGFDGKKKEDAKIELAIRLGAKPPRNKYKNYKLLQGERKKEKEALASDLNLQQIGKNKVGKSLGKSKGFDRKKRKEARSNILDVYGRVKVGPKLRQKSK